jgi:hypothetical protein
MLRAGQPPALHAGAHEGGLQPRDEGHPQAGLRREVAGQERCPIRGGPGLGGAAHLRAMRDTEGLHHAELDYAAGSSSSSEVTATNRAATSSASAFASASASPSARASASRCRSPATSVVITQILRGTRCGTSTTRRRWPRQPCQPPRDICMVSGLAPLRGEQRVLG